MSANPPPKDSPLMPKLTVNETRFFALFDAQAAIGATPEGGLSRPALSEADHAIRRWFADRAAEYGLIYAMDGAGNQTARLSSAHPDAKTVIIGSHLDSVPNGGRFDGALGVIAALEVILTLRDAGIALPFHLEAINFTDEESALIGLFGSSALTGALRPESLIHPRGGRDQLLAGMQRIGLTEAGILSAARPPESLLAYLEVHIEQGTRLESA